MMVQSRIVHSDSCHPLCPTDNQQTQTMEEISQFEFVALCQMADNQNKTFYVKYLNNQAVPVHTNFVDSQTVRLLPLSTVADLIAAFQARPGSLLASVDSGLITLHTSETDETALEPDQPLSNMASGNTAKTALIIKYNSDAGSNNNGSSYGCRPTSSSLEAMECGGNAE